MLHGIVCGKISISAKYGLDKITNEGVDDDIPFYKQGFVTLYSFHFFSFHSLIPFLIPFKDNEVLSEFREEVWSFFATGINLQELYIYFSNIH